MATIFIELDSEYIPKTEDQNIHVRVILGNGQSGGYVIFLDQELKASNKIANLGNKSDVSGKTTTIVATIMDKLKETNWTSVVVEFLEGTFVTTFGPFEKQVPDHLDTAIYIIKIMHP